MKDKVKKTKNNMRYHIAAAIIFAIFLAVFMWTQMGRRGQVRYDVVVFGDSMVGLCRDETSVTAVLAEILQRPVFNAAFGGTCMAVQDEDLEVNYTMALLNMVSLSKAIAADDFGAQMTVRSRRAITDFFAEVIEELPQIDLEKTETIVLAYGLNDYHAGIPVDNAKDPFDENTFGGALRRVLRTMQKKYPGQRIILMTPTYTWYLANGLTCEEYVTGEAFLETYVDKMMEIAAEFDVEAIDLYHDMYRHETWEDWSLYTIDGLHPDQESRRWIAKRLAEVIETE